MSDSDSNHTESEKEEENDTTDGESEEEVGAESLEKRERKKRSTGYAWCGVDSEIDNSSSSSTHNDPFYHGNPNTNPVLGPRMQLYCKTGWFLALYSQNEVRGSIEEFDKHTFFEFSSTPVAGDVRIQCLDNKLFLAMKKSGRLYGEADPSKTNTIFIESLLGQYNVYLSRKWAHLGYYIALRRSGKVKKGPKTEYGQKAIQFLPLRKNIQ